MYRLNNLHRNVLITPDEVIAKSPTSHTMDHNGILHSIEIAEERFIRPALGSGLYEAICAEKNRLVTEGNKADMQAGLSASGLAYTLKVGDRVNASELLSPANRKLWDGYLWKLVAECVRFTVIPEAYAQLNAQGITKQNPTVDVLGTAAAKSVGIDLRDAKWLMDKWMSDRIDPLLEAMHTFVCTTGGYAGYGRPCPCAEEQAHTRKSDWVTGIYDDDQSPCSCW